MANWLSFTTMLFLGMERNIFLINENWQGDFLQGRPGLEAPGMQTSHRQTLAWQRHKKTHFSGDVQQYAAPEWVSGLWTDLRPDGRNPK